MTKTPSLACRSKQKPSCHYCEGKGYREIRDCSGEIQRSETCVFCGGTGVVREEGDEGRLTPGDRVSFVSKFVRLTD